MNINLPTYLNLVNFWDLPENQQVKHLLFFVTVIAGLRKDMTPRILAQRLNDQKLEISENRVKEILDTYTNHFERSSFGDTRDRLEDEQAYMITKDEQKKLSKAANLKWAKITWWNNKDVFLILAVSAILFLIVFCVGIWECMSSSANCLDWSGYKSRLDMNSTKGPENAKYFLYFITEHLKFRRDMTPDVISDRLSDAGLGKTSSADIKKYFSSHPDEVTLSDARAGAYKISDREAKKIKDKLDVNFNEKAPLEWIFKHLPLTIIFGFLAALFTCVGSVYIWGRAKGRETFIQEELVRIEN